MLPPAEGMLTSHRPVAADEVTRVPKTKRTYLFASVSAYTLERVRLSDSGHRGMGWPPHLIVRNTWPSDMMKIK